MHERVGGGVCWTAVCKWLGGSSADDVAAC